MTLKQVTDFQQMHWRLSKLPHQYTERDFAPAFLPSWEFQRSRCIGVALDQQASSNKNATVQFMCLNILKVSSLPVQRVLKKSYRTGVRTRMQADWCFCTQKDISSHYFYVNDQNGAVWKKPFQVFLAFLTLPFSYWYNIYDLVYLNSSIESLMPIHRPGAV